MWIKKLKQKKLQFSLVAMILFSASIIFSACLSFTIETGNYSKEVYKNGNCPEYFMYLNGDNIEPLLEEQKTNSSVEQIFTLEGRQISGKMTVEGDSIVKQLVSFFAIENYKELPWDVKISGGTDTPCPGAGEIWITGLYADLNNIKVGDFIEIDGEKPVCLKVSALMNNALCPSTMVGVSPFYINKENLSDFPENAKSTFISLDVEKDVDQASNIIEGFSNEFKKNIIMDIDSGDLIMCLSMSASILGGIGTIAAFMIFIVSIVIIRFILKSTIMKEFKLIGIYKALGFKNREIRGYYLKCYTVVGSVSIMLGAIAGMPVSVYISNIVLKYVGQLKPTEITLFAISATIVLMLLLLVINVRLSLKSVKKVTPVEAFRIGTTSTKEKLTKSFIKNAYSSLSIAINDIMKHKSMSIMIVLILTVSFFLTILFSTINDSINGINDNTAKWFVIPNADCVINIEATEDRINAVSESKYVKYLNYGTSNIGEPIECKEKDSVIDMSKIAAISYNDCSNEATGISYIYGRAPKNTKEISFSYQSINNSDYRVGDYIDLKIGDYETSYLITGIHSGLRNGGRSLILPISELERCNVKFTPDSIFINLNNPDDYEAFKTETEEKFSDMSVERTVSGIEDTIKSMTDMFTPITALSVSVFIIFSLLNIINLLMMNTLQNRRQYGILKAIGFSTGYICRKNLYRILLLSFISIILALAIHFSISQKMFFAMISVDGLLNDPMLITAMIGSVLAMIILITLIFCIPIGRIKPIELMEE